MIEKLVESVVTEESVLEDVKEELKVRARAGAGRGPRDSAYICR